MQKHVVVWIALALILSTVASAITILGRGNTVQTSATNGTLTSISAGVGITLSPNPLSTTGTITAKYTDFYNALTLDAGNNLTNIAGLNNRILIDCSNITGGSDPNYCVDSSGSGTVTSVTCGTGLSGGTFTTDGTCAVDYTTFTNRTLSSCSNISGATSNLCTLVDTDTNSGGTVTSVTCGNGLLGGAFTTTGTCSANYTTFYNQVQVSWLNVTGKPTTIAAANVTGTLANVQLANSSITINVNNGLTGSATTQLGSTQTILCSNATASAYGCMKASTGLSVTNGIVTVTNPVIRSYVTLGQTGDVGTASTTTYAATNLNFTIAASTNYTYRCEGAVYTSLAVIGPQINITVPTSPTYFTAFMNTPATSSGTDTFNVCSGTINSCVITPAKGGLTPGLPFSIRGRLINGVTAGNLEIWFRSTGAATINISRESYCEMYTE